MASAATPRTDSQDGRPSDLRIELIEDPANFPSVYELLCATFGRQTGDGFFAAASPGWDTPEGHVRGAKRMEDRWRRATKDRNGKLNTVFLKATIDDGNERVIAGAAVWVQASAVAGHGDPPVDDLSKATDLEKLHPGNPALQKLLCQLDQSLHRPRNALVKKIATESNPSLFVLDLCVVHPTYQGRGIAKKLVQWGLEEAKARGDIECVTEGSAMGRHVYFKLGFEQDGPEIEWFADEPYKDYNFPSNIFMRTRLPKAS